MSQPSSPKRAQPDTQVKPPSPPAPPSREEQIAALKQRKIALVTARNEQLEREVAALRIKIEEVTAELKHPAQETVRKHIKLLHEYNEIRDIGQGLIGLIADQKNVRVGELYEDFGIGLKD